MTATAGWEGLELQGLYDCARIVRELHVKRATAEALMRACPRVQRIPDSRKVFVLAEDLAAVLARHQETK